MFCPPAADLSVGVGLIWEIQDNMTKRMITRGLLCIMCVLSLFIYCNFDDDDENHHHDDPNLAYSSPWRQELHKEYQVRLPSEILPLFHVPFLRNPASGATLPDDFVAGVW